MDRERKEELSLQLRGARVQLGVNRSMIQEELSISHQFKRSVKKAPLPWVLGALGTSLVVGMILRRPFRRPTVVVEGRPRGVISRGSGLLFGLAKPAITAFVLDRVRLEMENRLGEGSANSMLGLPPQK